VGKVFAPVNGELLESNGALEMDPTIINRDCYGEGWIYRIRPNDMGEVQNLISGSAAIEKWLLADIEKYKT
jgi:glycine cleavage system H protein